MIDKLHNDEQNPPIKLNKSFYNFKNDDINLISFKKNNYLVVNLISYIIYLMELMLTPIILKVIKD